jgi:heme/copper-type cytochrome/quinol oxidase subunit 2
MRRSNRPDRRGITVLALVILIIVAVLLVIFLIRYLGSPTAAAQVPAAAMAIASAV